MWKALDNPWPNRAGTVVFLLGAVQTVVRWLMGLPLNAIGVLLLAGGVILMLLPKLQRLGGQRQRSDLPQANEGSVPDQSQRPIGEIALASEEAVEMATLTLGRAQMPTQSRRMIIDPDTHPVMHPKGRVVQVPVMNSQGGATAKSVQALLHFRPDDVQGTYSPRDPVLAEWDTDPPTTSIDIPGNGQPHLFNVALVLDAVHPCIFQWTRHSREAKLDGYGVAGRGVIRVEVRAAGPGAPSATDTLHIEAVDGLLSAQWESEGLGTRGNWVPWRSPPLLGPPPGTRAS